MMTSRVVPFSHCGECRRSGCSVVRMLQVNTMAVIRGARSSSWRGMLIYMFDSGHHGQVTRFDRVSRRYLFRFRSMLTTWLVQSQCPSTQQTNILYTIPIQILKCDPTKDVYTVSIKNLLMFLQVNPSFWLTFFW